MSAPNSYHLAYCVSRIKVLPGHQDTVRHSRLPSYAVVQQPNTSHCKEILDTPSPHFPLPPGHGMLLPQLHHCINRKAHRPVPHQPHHLPPPSKKGLEMHDKEGRFKPDQLPELNSHKALRWHNRRCNCVTVQDDLYLCCVLTLFLSTCYAFSPSSLC